MRKSSFIVVAMLGLLIGRAESFAKPVEFDFADPNATSEGRADTIVAPQSLYLLNGTFILAQAS